MSLYTTFSAIYLHISHFTLGLDAKNRSTQSFINYALRPNVMLTGAVYAVDVDNVPRAVQADPTLYVVRGIYAFSKRTDVYVSAAYASADNNQLVSLSREEVGYGSSQSGITLGIQHRF